ncbi:hypothetical protein LOD99_14597 [Oopsacas minuta]|uniref:Tc1-like transposase DDE domain-containing protein n=1 Tax=Oopsacas minuta TaxID=111878 RepID=A0AAV7KHQ6_9METZ|nr:hypothetical protein LOD99_14597 [Oopsacas minuta]
MWTKSDQKRIVPTTKHSPKINVRAGFSPMGIFPLCILTENMNSQMFIDILEGHLLTHAEIFHRNEWRLVMDNDTKHSSKLAKAYLVQNIPNHLPWPSQSPNINPIENIFSWAKRELIKLALRTIPELRKKREIV